MKIISYKIILFFSIIIIFIASAFFTFNLTSITNDDTASDSWTHNQQILVPEKNPNSNTVVMIHGFAGSPFDFKPLALKLVKNGYKVVLPVTPGQLNLTYSYNYYDLPPQYYINWINTLISNEIKNTTGKLYLVGFSMGGTLATIAAVSNSIDKLILIAPFYRLTIANNFIWRLSRLISIFIKGIPNLSLGAINSSKGKELYRMGSKVIRLDAYDSLEKLALIAIKHIPSIHVPTLILASVNDDVASFEYTNSLFKNKSNVKIIEYKKSNHVLLYDYESDSIISNIVNFLDTE